MFSYSVEDTRRIAAELARGLPPGTRVLALSGGLGAGKTAFAQGFIEALGYAGTVASPTYAIVNEYFISGAPTVTLCFHFDWYRLNSPEELDDIGWEEYPERGLCVVEWSDRIPGALPEHTVNVNIRVLDENTREIIIM
ncbi:MAG: tRNA (adenosine(37)-N6)-threonylcarbamoyltransferase complex ATPase subunit type 1 TsaE [Oscillospiraceae bacterium]|nr:tRNA (adenosine(37)-N6)-threonylcarbamoyltransferase complex ATPase subunit type 1 TsaE [Oscillospiraceae bacterium]